MQAEVKGRQPEDEWGRPSVFVEGVQSARRGVKNVCAARRAFRFKGIDHKPAQRRCLYPRRKQGHECFVSLSKTFLFL